MEKVRIYTNQITLERTRQEQLAPEDREKILANRIARAQATRLVAIGLVADELGDKSTVKAVKEKLGVKPQVSLAKMAEMVESRRPQKNKQYLELTAA